MLDLLLRLDAASQRVICMTMMGCIEREHIWSYIHSVMSTKRLNADVQTMFSLRFHM